MDDYDSGRCTALHVHVGSVRLPTVVYTEIVRGRRTSKKVGKGMFAQAGSASQSFGDIER